MQVRNSISCNANSNIQNKPRNVSQPLSFKNATSTISGDEVKKLTGQAINGLIGEPNTKKAVNDIFGWTARKANKLSKIVGELPGQVVNFIGTAFVSPFVIAFNPISKDDQDTKTYSAMRQPISAILALVTQTPFTVGFNNWFIKQASLGNLGKNYDLSIQPDGLFLKKQIKKYIRTNSYESINKDLRNILEKAEAKTYITSLNKDAKEDEIQTAIDNIQKVLKDKIKNEEVLDFEKPTDKQLLARMLDSNVQINDNLALNKITNKQDLDKLSKTIDRVLNKGIEKFKTGTERDEIKACVNEYTDIAGEYARNILVNRNKLNKDLLDNGNLLEFKDHLRNTLWDYVGEITKAKNGDANATEKGREAAKNIKRGRDLLNELNEKTKDFLKEQITKHKIESTTARVKGAKQVGGIMVALSVVVPACYILNWVYPRAMEKFFPNLSKSKKAKQEGGNK